MKKLRLILMTALIVIAAGCASIVSDSVYDVSFSSSPSGADISITNRAGTTIYEGATPTIATLYASAGFFTPENYAVRVSFQGYEDQLFIVRATIDGWYWGNFIFGGPIGFLIVDPLTGAMYKIERTQYSIVLNEAGIAEPTSQSGRGLHIINYQTLSKEAREHLIKMDQPLD